MSIEHLEKLRNSLESSHWVVHEELPGDDYKISAYWKVSRPNGDSAFNLAFEGFDDMRTHPIEKAYGCHVVGKEEIGFYFGKLGKSFPNELSKFIESLSSVDT